MLIRIIKQNLDFYLFLITIAIFLTPYIAECSGVGTSGNTMLKIGVGAKATSMGEAIIAETNDITSIYWNPAGLVRVRKSEFSAMHVEWFDDIRYEWIGFAQPLSRRFTIGADVSYLYMGSIPRTIESITEEYEQDGTFTPVDIAGRIALSFEALNGLLVGASLQRIQSQVNFEKITKSRIDDKIAQGMAIDVGCIYDLPKIKGLSLGTCFQNFGGQSKGFITKKESMPFSMNIGMAYKMQMKTEKKQENTTENEVQTEQKTDESRISGSLTIASSVAFPSDDSINAHIGLEYRFRSGISFRGGFKTDSSFDFPAGLSGGIGYDSSTYQIDYAIVPYGYLGNTHRVSFNIKF